MSDRLVRTTLNAILSEADAMNKHYVSLLLALPLTMLNATAGAQSASALVQINGHVYGTTCSLVSSNINVPLQDAGTYQFDTVGGLLDMGTSVNIQLQNCSTAVANTANLSFTGTLVGADPTELRLSAGPASAVAIVLRIPSSLNQTLAFVPFDGTVLNLPLSSGSVTYSFPVAYKTLQLPVPVGTVNALASFTISYS